MFVVFCNLQFVAKLKQIGPQRISIHSTHPSIYPAIQLLHFITDKYIFDHRSAAANAARARLLPILSSIEFGFYNFYYFLFDLLYLRTNLFQYISL